jgi:hypothetical protein
MLDRTSTFWRWTARCALLIVVMIIGPIALGQRQESLEGFMSGIRANAVKGDVVYQRNDGKFPLESGLKLEEGDFVRSRDGYAELLLQPGNYLRVGDGTECQIVSEPYDKMRLKLNHGTINLELLSRDNSSYWWYPMEKTTELIRVITPDAVVFINQPGVVRINASAGRTEVVVREGEAVLNGRRVKKKRRAVAANGSVIFAEIDTRTEDNFDAWSRERAGQLVQRNKLLKNEPPWSNRKKDVETAVEMPDDDAKENKTRGLVISARPGAVNFVEDGVELGRNTKEWTPLTEKSQLEEGDTLRTSANSLVELTLFPDMHFRLNESSEVLFDELSNDSISLKVLRGSAIVDVARFDRKQSPQITIGGSSTSAVINDHGNYRIDARDGSNTITVREGKVVFNERSVGGCKRIDGRAIYDCDRKRSDNFDFWSQHRGEGELYNERGMVAMVTHLTRLRRYRFRNTGFWYQQPGQTSYTFVPFTSEFFRSPYGGHYSTVLSPQRTTMTRGDGRDRSSRRPRGPEIAPARP